MKLMPAKYQQLAQKLKEQLPKIEKSNSNKLPTEMEIAASYNVSRQTVRHALCLLEEEGLLIRRQGSGTYINSNKNVVHSNQIAVMTTFLDDYIFPTILRDLQSVFSTAGYSTLIFATNNSVSSERNILMQLMEQNIAALLVEGSKSALPTPNEDLYLQLKRRNIPILFLHGSYSNLNEFPCVLDNNFNGGYLLTKYLIDKGHKKIAGIFKSDDIQGPQRYHGVLSALRDNNMPICDDRFCWYDTVDRFAMINSENCDLLNNFIQHRLSDSSAIVCYNDEIAYRVVQKLFKNGLHVPINVSVVSFDNSYYCKMGNVTITSLRHKNNNTGIIAAKSLLDMLSGIKIPPITYMEWELIERSSSK